MVVMCGSGEVYVCALDDKGLTLAVTIELGAKVSLHYALHTLQFNCSYYCCRP